jgi:hypothetical protein
MTDFETEAIEWLRKGKVKGKVAPDYLASMKPICKAVDDATAIVKSMTEILDKASS